LEELVTFEEMLGKMMAAQIRIEDKVDRLQTTVGDLANKWLQTNQDMKRLPCNDTDPSELTNPDCPALLEVGDDEPHSVVTEQVSVHAPGFEYRGPGIVGLALALIAGAVVIVGLLSGHVAIH
jgi:hypothetical protein